MRCESALTHDEIRLPSQQGAAVLRLMVGVDVPRVVQLGYNAIALRSNNRNIATQMTTAIINIFTLSAGIDVRRPNLTSTDVRF